MCNVMIIHNTYFISELLGNSFPHQTNHCSLFLSNLHVDKKMYRTGKWDLKHDYNKTFTNSHLSTLHNGYFILSQQTVRTLNLV